jgi:cell division protein FtsB
MKIDEEDKKTKSDDDFLKIPLHQWNVQEKTRDKYGISRIKEFLPSLLPVSLVLIILLALATGYVWTQVSALNAGIKNMNLTVNNMDVGGLKSRLIIAENSIEEITKENGRLKAELARLHNELEATRARKEKADAAALKQASAKKKPAAAANKRAR